MSETTANELLITRTFNAPRELVFQCWTQPEHLAHWWGPTGMELEVLSHDLRPGGAFHFSMKAPDGFQMWAKFVYNEITSPEKLVYTSSFSDAEANIIRAPFSPIYPLEVFNSMKFEEQDSRTVLTLRGGPVNSTEEEAAFYASMMDDMQQGFGGTFAQLDEYLAKLA